MGGEAKLKPEIVAAQRVEAARKAREKDMAAGAAKGQEYFGEGSLGRVDAARAQEISDVLARRQANLQGYTPEEQNAMRSQALGGVQRAQQLAQRQLMGQLGAANLRGGARGGALGNLAAQGLQQQAQVEQGLFANQINQRRAALDQYQNALQGARADELARQQYNQLQGNKERQGRLTTEMGFASMGAGERGAIGQQVAGEYAADREKDKK